MNKNKINYMSIELNISILIINQKKMILQMTQLQQEINYLLIDHKNSKESELSINQQIVQQNKQITKSLQTSRQLLSASILQSELNIENLDQQTKDLYKLNENFLQFNDLLNKSKQIVKFIEKQDKADRQRIYLSMGFFILCCCWVVYRRILRRPIKILLWSF